MGQEYIREGKRFLYEESGIGVVEIILILVVNWCNKIACI